MYLPKSSVVYQLSGKMSIHASVFFLVSTQIVLQASLLLVYAILHSPSVAAVGETRKLNDNSDCNQDKYFSFEVW